MVKPDAFKLISGKESLGEYRWGAKISTRYNLNTIDDLDLGDAKIIYWDGRHDNWMGGPRSTPWPIEATKN